MDLVVAGKEAAAMVVAPLYVSIVGTVRGPSTLGAAPGLEATFNALAPSLGEITSNFDWIPAITRSTNTVALKMRVWVGAFRKAIRTNSSARSISAAWWAQELRVLSLRVCGPMVLVPVAITARNEVVVELVSNTCCNWRIS